MGNVERYTAVIYDFSLFFPPFSHSLSLKCAALHKDDVGKILPYYPIMKRTSESAAFICRQLVSCTIFILMRGKSSTVVLHHHLLGLCRQSPLQQEHASSSLPLWSKDWFLCLSLMRLDNCCAEISSGPIRKYKLLLSPWTQKYNNWLRKHIGAEWTNLPLTWLKTDSSHFWWNCCLAVQQRGELHTTNSHSC